MHFVGPDQLHGFEERVTTDMYPGDFGWTPTWDDPARLHWWYHNMLSVTEAGPYDRSLEMDYDEEVGFRAVRWLYDAARSDDTRPFMLTVSFMDPHDPYLAPRADWELYDHAAIDMPAVPSMARDLRDPLGQRLHDVYDRGEYRVTDSHVRAARRAYYAMITYIDREFGKLLAALKAAGLADNTVVIATADHGDMLGERGLWYKMNFYERSTRVPLIIHWPGVLTARRVSQNVSLVDLLPTFREIAGDRAAPVVPIDGHSLVSLASGSAGGWSDSVQGEYMAEGTFQPLFMIRRGTYKYVSCHGDPPQLFDLSKDPNELTNLAEQPAHAERAAEFAREVAAKWDSKKIRDDVVTSQRQRILVQEALLKGQVHPWDFQPREDASKQYNRNYSSELYDTDRRARMPFRPEPEKGA
jgi:choline-sulfatase